MDMVNRLAPPAVGQFVRRLSANSEDIDLQIQRQPNNEYFQQVYQAQHPEENQPRQQHDLLGGLKDRLSPAGAAIGQAFRKLSHTDTDIRTTLPQNEYLQQIHAHAIAEQNRREAEEQESVAPHSLNIVSGITSRIGTAVRRLSTYEDDPNSNLSSRDAFKFFQLDDRAKKAEEAGGDPGRRGGLAVPMIILDSDTSMKKKKKNKWKDLIALTKAKSKVQSQVSFLCLSTTITYIGFILIVNVSL